MDSSKFVEKLQRRVVQNFMDTIILTEMKKGSLTLSALFKKDLAS